jgi:sodium-dependent phosphate transporter
MDCGAGPEAYLWLVIVSGFAAFIMAFGIGANDVANSFATSVGSGTLKLWHAVIIAGIFEFLGAVLLGAQVTRTIRSGIADADFYENEPQVLMLGMFTALVGAGVWVMVCSRFGLAVSTTHSTVGAILGFSLVARGAESINWLTFGLIVVSWFASPILSGLLSSGVFATVRHFVLRKEDPLSRAYRIYPILVAITLAVNIFFLVSKTELSKSLEEWKGVLIAIGVGIGCAIIIQVFLMPYIRRRVETLYASKSGAAGKDVELGMVTPTTSVLDTEAVPSTVSLTCGDVPVSTAASTVSGTVSPQSTDAKSVEEELPASDSKVWKSMRDLYGRQKERLSGDTLFKESMSSEGVQQMHDRAEVFDEKTEVFFSLLQVVTACFGSFAHGANDVANSIAPFAAVVSIYATGQVVSDSPVPVWVLLIGGIGIVAGLALYGYRVIQALGVSMIKVTPARGFTIELSTAFVVTIASYIGVPISTTHCQVGATAAVGLCEGKSGINSRLLLNTFVSWLATVVFSGGVSAALFSLMYFSP